MQFPSSFFHYGISCKFQQAVCICIQNTTLKVSVGNLVKIIANFHKLNQFVEILTVHHIRSSRDNFPFPYQYKASQVIQSPRTVPFFLLVSLLDGYSFPNVLVKGIVAFKH